ncbi:MAG: xerD 9 [Herbinix sp.]|jgi:integrase/recombinase XerD|nr:xerD 9 [Herbinix sp.]
MKKISMKTNQNLTLEEGFNQFIKMCKVKNLSPKTTETYEWHFLIFTRFIEKDTPIENINGDTIDDYIMHLKNRSKVRDITINSYIRSLRAYFGYLTQQEYIEKFTIHMLKVNKKIKETYTNDELHVLLKKPDLKTCDFTEYKTWVFSNYLLATGNRISSALNLRISDLDFDNSLILINKTKNRKSQIIPMSKSISGILMEYLQYREGGKDDFVFCTSCGKQGNIHTYQGLLQRYNRSRGVTKTSAHLYRHTFAKQWILNGGDIFRLQKILGHSDLTVVKEYVNMFGNDLSIDFNRFNPLDTLGLNQQWKQIKM